MRWSGREARQRPAKPSTRVQIPSPPRLRGARARRRVRPPGRRRAIGAAVARFPDTEEVTGSIPVSPTTAEPQVTDLGLSVSGSRRLSRRGDPLGPEAVDLRRELARRAAVVQDDVGDRPALLVGRLRRDAGPGVLGRQPALDEPGHPGLGIGLHDQHEVVGGRLTGLDEQRDVVDDDGVQRARRRRPRRPGPGRAGGRSRRAGRGPPGRRTPRRPGPAGPATRRRRARRRRTPRRRPPAPGCPARPPRGRSRRRPRSPPRVRPGAGRRCSSPTRSRRSARCAARPDSSDRRRASPGRRQGHGRITRRPSCPARRSSHTSHSP